MPIFMKVEGIKGGVIEAARSGTGGTTDDVVVDGRIITGENWAFAAADTGTHEVGHLITLGPTRSSLPMEEHSFNDEKIRWSSDDAPDLLTVADAEAAAGGGTVVFGDGSVRFSTSDVDPF